MQWESPWGVGFPGWHLECSAIILESLGETIDIHCGGVDHIPVHHTNEIAQSEAKTGKKLANYWLHNDFLLVDEQKMSKSLGNLYTLSDLEKQGVEPFALKMFFYLASYRSKINFTWEGVKASDQALKRLRKIVSSLTDSDPNDGYKEDVQQFLEFLADDLNTAKAIAFLWEVLRSDKSDSHKKQFVKEIDLILRLNLCQGVQMFELGDPRLPDSVNQLLEERAAARLGRDWEASDRLRSDINSLGYEIIDSESGQILTKASK